MTYALYASKAKSALAHSLTWQVAVLDDVVQDWRVSVVLRCPADLQRATADLRETNGRR